MLGEWAGIIAFPIPEQGEWPRHGDGRYLRPDFVQRTPPFLTWARPIFEQGALSPMSVFPANFPILCLPGDKLFQSKELDDGYSLPPVVHAFHGSKVGLGQKLQQWQSKGLQPLAVSLIGVDEAPPLWAHPTGCDFVRGSQLVAKPHVGQQRSLTKTQVLLLQSLWMPVEVPNYNNDHTPWPLTCQTAHVLCGQQASLQLPTAQILPLLEALQKRLGIDPSNAELAINEVLASHADPQYTDWKIIIMDNTAWQLNPTDPGSLDVQCTGLGGGELDQEWDVLLACRKEAHVYGPSLWHNCRNRPHPRILATAYSHVPNWCPHLVPCSRSAQRPPTASTDHQPCYETPTFLSHYPGPQETTMARVQARPATL